MPSRISKFDPAYDQKSLVYRFLQHVSAKDFLKSPRKILIACSGGPDSMALFHLLRMAFPQKTKQFVLVHFNHALRKTARRDEVFVKKAAKQYGVPFVSGKAKNLRQAKTSVEEAARAKRYEFLSQVYKRQKAGAVLLAHHLDDQAETVLMRMCQGTGPRGLLGIREELDMRGMRAMRPLLPFSKKELLHFLKEHDFDFCRDETNSKRDFLRNRIRLEVLPFLEKQINPRVMQALARIPETLASEQNFLEGAEKAAWKKSFASAGKGKIALKAAAFRALHPALQFRVLDAALKKIDPSAGLLFDHALLVGRQLQKRAFRLALSRSILLVSDRRFLTLKKA